MADPRYAMRPRNDLQVFAPGLFEDRLCLVTGGGTGIGLAVARHFARGGGRVVLLGRRLEVLEEAADGLRKAGGAWVQTAKLDIREAEEVETTIKGLVAESGPIGVLVNNAGGQFAAPAETISSRGFEAIVRNNLLGTWNVTRAVATEGMIPHGGGVITNVIANVARGFPGMVHTGAARAGVDNMTKTLAIEWMTHGIRVNAIAPGIIETPALGKYPPEMLTHARGTIPMKRLGTTEEVARTVAFMCSDAATYITGETLYVDGGQRLWGESWPIPEEPPTGGSADG